MVCILNSPEYAEAVLMFFEESNEVCVNLENALDQVEFLADGSA